MLRFICVLMAILLTTAAAAAEFRPVMVYDSPTTDDASWNTAIHAGLERFTRQTGIAVAEDWAASADEMNDKVLRRAREGYDPILLASSIHPETRAMLAFAAAHFPDTRFVSFNGSTDTPHAHHFVFSNQESSFLAGYLAARKSRTGILGFVGGMDRSSRTSSADTSLGPAAPIPTCRCCAPTSGVTCPPGPTPTAPMIWPASRSRRAPT